jgi:hypothetical protein
MQVFRPIHEIVEEDRRNKSAALAIQAQCLDRKESMNPLV